MTDVMVTDRDRELASEYEAAGIPEMAQALARARAEGFAAGVAQERERAAETASEHQCGYTGDIMCNGRNCAMLIAAAIRARGSQPQAALAAQREPA